MSLVTSMTYQQILDHLDTLPGPLAIYWVLENVDAQHPQREQLMQYCRARVLRYQANYKQEMLQDSITFKRMRALKDKAA